MERVALAVWNGRISPVFDVTRRLLIVDVEGTREQGRSEASLESTELGRRAAQLLELEVDTLLCGAISRSLAALLAGNGICLLPFIAGEVEEVLEAYLSGNTLDPALAMPGCCGRRQRRRGRRGAAETRPWSETIGLEGGRIMPGGDGTGPQGQGPRTGWGRGGCDPEGEPRRPGRTGGDRGPGRGQGLGRGQGGRGRGAGRGRGRRSG